MLQFIKSSYFQSLIESFAGGVLIFNVDGQIYSANSKASAILGLPVEALYAKTWDTLFAAAAQDPDLDEFLALARDPERSPHPVVITSPCGGTVRMVSLERSLMVDYGKVFGIILQMTDLTQVYALHERQRRLLEENRQLESQRVEGLRKLAMSVAHQIRNPVMIIGNFARMLLRAAPTQGPEADKLSAILSSGVRLDRIVAAVAEYCALGITRRETLSLARVVDQAREAALTGDGARAQFALEVGDEMVSGDSALLVRAVLELFRNALESREGEPVRVRVRAVAMGGMVRLEVEDDGPGFCPDQGPFLFDPFSTTKPDALGMGLCLCRRIALEHGGDLRVETLDKGGVLASLDLPRPGDAAIFSSTR